jgi:rod shape-determining protein MreB
MTDVLVIDIGAGTTDLCRMHGTVPADEDQISFQIAGDAVDKKLLDLIKERYPEAQVTQNMCKQFKELYGFVSDTKDRVVVTIPVNGKPTPHDITDQLKQACELLVQPILDGIHELVQTFDPEFQDRLRNNVILSGGGGLLRGLNKRIEDGLTQTVGSAHVSVVEEPLYAGANGALQLAALRPRPRCARAGTWPMSCSFTRPRQTRSCCAWARTRPVAARTTASPRSNCRPARRR